MQVQVFILISLRLKLRLFAFKMIPNLCHDNS